MPPIPEWINKWIDKLDEENTASIPVEPERSTPIPGAPQPLINDPTYNWELDPTLFTANDLECPIAPLDASEE